MYEKCVKRCEMLLQGAVARVRAGDVAAQGLGTLEYAKL